MIYGNKAKIILSQFSSRHLLVKKCSFYSCISSLSVTSICDINSKIWLSFIKSFGQEFWEDGMNASDCKFVNSLVPGVHKNITHR